MKKARRFLVASALALVGAGGVVGVAAAAGSPSVTTGGVTNRTTTSDGKAQVVMHGSVNPNGASTSYAFEYGLTTSYGLTSASHSAGSGTKSTTIKVTVGGLLPGTAYHYRLVASNRFGETLGVDRTFTTAGNPPPDVATGPANNVDQSSASLTGVINPHSEVTNWVFQWGLTSAYDEQTFGGSVPAGTAPVTVTQALNGIQAGQTFHYRLVAFHGSVPVAGTDGTFTTEPSVRPFPKVTARTTPRRKQRRPYVFTTTGKIAGPARFPASDNCTGTVTVLFFVGHHGVGISSTPVNPDCTYTTSTNVHPGINRRHPRRRLTVVTHFDGNGYIAPRAARDQVVQAG